MRIVVLLAVATVVAGCYQPACISPEPLAAGDYCGSLALTGYSDSYYAGVMLQGRAGLGAGVDAGVRLSFPGELCPYVPVGLYGDIKWNFLSSPCLLNG
jgi:hypothetical protein